MATPLKDATEGLLQVGENFDSMEGMKKNAAAVPVVAVFGANAAGKSTVLRALEFFVAAIRDSHNAQSTRHGTPYTPFLLDDESRHIPSRYDADFVLGGTRYHYGFTLDGEIINSEWLYSFPIGKQRQSRSVLFHRDSTEDEAFYFGKNLKGDNKTITKFVRENSLFLSAAAQNSHPHLTLIYEYFASGVSKRLNSIDDSLLLSKQMHAYFNVDEKQRKMATSFMRAADIGIADIQFSKKPTTEKTKLMIQEFEQFISKHSPTDIKLDELLDKTEAQIFHTGKNGKKYPIKLENESAGTKALLQLLGPVFDKLKHGGILIVDELNIALHPLVTKELINLFSHPDTNPGHAQLIFTTHDTSTLTTGLLRRDQVWFVEKDEAGSTSLYSLSSIKSRSNDNFEKGYIDGRFGAIPMYGLGNNYYKKIKSNSSDNED
jgi:AAA15 family ATPase/GTPase